MTKLLRVVAMTRARVPTLSNIMHWDLPLLEMSATAMEISIMPLPSRDVSMTIRMSATALDCTMRDIELDCGATLDAATALTETVIGLDSASLNTTGEMEVD